jgi:hypothetical protein
MDAWEQEVRVEEIDAQDDGAAMAISSDRCLRSGLSVEAWHDGAFVIRVTPMTARLFIGDAPGR